MLLPLLRSRVILTFYPIGTLKLERKGDADMLGLYLLRMPKPSCTKAGEEPCFKSAHGVRLPFGERSTCASVGSLHDRQIGSRVVTHSGIDVSRRTRRAQPRKARKGLLVNSHGDAAE